MKTQDKLRLMSEDWHSRIGYNSACEVLSRAADELDAAELQRDTAWAQAHRLALELECLLLDTKDIAVVSKWWDSGMEALSEYREIKPGAAEEAEAWGKMRKAGI